MTDDIDDRVRCVTCSNLRNITCTNAVMAGLERRRRATDMPRDFITLKQRCGGYRSQMARVVCSRCGREGHLPKDCRWPVVQRSANAAQRKPDTGMPS